MVVLPVTNRRRYVLLSVAPEVSMAYASSVHLLGPKVKGEDVPLPAINCPATKEVPPMQVATCAEVSGTIPLLPWSAPFTESDHRIWVVVETSVQVPSASVWFSHWRRWVAVLLPVPVLSIWIRAISRSPFFTLAMVVLVQALRDSV